MAKIIIAAAAAEGHINPFLPIISELIARQHEVHCLTGEKFRPRVERLGATFHPFPRKWDASITEVYDLFPELKKKKGVGQVKHYMKNVLHDPVPDLVESLQQILKQFPADVVVADNFMIAPVWLTELGGPPNICLSVLPLALPDPDVPPFGLGWQPGKSVFSKWRNRFMNWLFDQLLFKDVQRYSDKTRAILGLPPYDKNLFIKEFELPSVVLHTSTPAFEYPRSALPENVRFIGPVKIPPQVDFSPPPWWEKLKEDKPVVLITQGTISKNYDNLIRPAIEALKEENMTVLAVPVQEGELSPLPKNTFAEPYIPFGNLLPHVDIIITNGGFGGTQQALAHGIPILAAGDTEDKMEVAARVEYTGAGINLRRQKPTPSAIRKGVLRLLSDPKYKEKAEAVQADFARYDAAKMAADSVEEVIRQQMKTV